jgi:serine-type D-Ala-D-Ala endopeptidase (penicillin-binding protein 7)
MMFESTSAPQRVLKDGALNLLLKVVARCVCVLGLGLALGTGAVTAAYAAPAKKAVTVKKSTAGKASTKKAAVKVSGKSSAKLSAKSSAKLSSKGAHKSIATAKSRGAVVKVSGKASLRGAHVGKMQRVVIRGKNGKRMVRYTPVRTVAYVPAAPLVVPKPSFGQLAGLHGMQDELDLKSSVALVVDQDTREVLFSKNQSAVLPIASLTKLMTGVIVSEARLDMGEMIEITQDDVDTEKGSRSRLKIGTQLARGELLLLALMSSENRAAHALGRTYPGGLERFVQHMNVKAAQLNMRDTRYVEPTGLSSRNQSSAQDLATLVGHAAQNPQLRELSTSPDHQVSIGEKTLNFVNTNRLTRNPDWEIGLQKTGYISEAGQCLVMQTKIAGRKLIMVFLDSAGKLSRLGDAERVRKWIEANRAMGVTPISAVHKKSTQG